MCPGISFLQEVKGPGALTKNSLCSMGQVLTELGADHGEERSGTAHTRGGHRTALCWHMLMLLNVSNPSAFQKWIGKVGGSGGDSNQSKGKSWPKKSQRESDLKGYRLVDANCMTFWKR